MKVTLITVEFRKTVSDREYGNESAHCQLSAEIEEGEEVTEAYVLLGTAARAHVMAQLSGSNNLQVRRNTNPRPRICNHCQKPLSDESNGYLHRECDQAMQDERAAARRLAEQETIDMSRSRGTEGGEPFQPEDDDTSLPWEEREPLAAAAADRSDDSPF